MPEHTTTPGEAGQGHEGAPAGGDKGFDFERSYQELRPEYTRTTQELSATRERLSEFEGLFSALHDPDPEVQRSAMEALGLEPVGDGPQTQQQDEFVDPLEQEVQELRAWKEQLEEQRQLEASQRETAELAALRDEYIDQELDQLANLRGEALTEREQEVLGNLAISMEREGVPDVRGAYEALYGNDGVLELNRARWIETKTGAAAAPLGRSIPSDQRPQTKAERIAYMDERLARLNEQQ